MNKQWIPFTGLFHAINAMSAKKPNLIEKDGVLRPFPLIVFSLYHAICFTLMILGLAASVMVIL